MNLTSKIINVAGTPTYPKNPTEQTTDVKTTSTPANPSVILLSIWKINIYIHFRVSLITQNIKLNLISTDVFSLITIEDFANTFVCSQFSVPLVGLILLRAKNPVYCVLQLVTAKLKYLFKYYNTNKYRYGKSALNWLKCHFFVDYLSKLWIQGTLVTLDGRLNSTYYRLSIPLPIVCCIGESDPEQEQYKQTSTHSCQI